MNGQVIGATKIVDNGDDAQLWNLAILAEGYQAAEMTTFHTDATNFVNTLQATPPYQAAWQNINVFRVDVASTDSGAADPVACGGTGAAPLTYFDATFCGDGTIQRLLICTDATVHSVVNQYVPTAHAILVIVNSSIYGGSEGGGYGVLSTAPDSDEIGLHELGHTFGLADEYPTWAGCGSDDSTHDSYAGGEPAQPNVTANTDRSTLKWRVFVNPGTAIPTTENADCTQCDPQPSPVPGGTVGLFEGAYYHHCAVYRPEFTCRMQELGQPYCLVCSFVIAAVISPCSVSIAASGGAPPPAELAALRTFRDREMVQSAEGRQLITLLERYGPELSAHLIVDDGLHAQAAALLQRASVVALSGDRGPELRFDRGVIGAAENLLDALTARAGTRVHDDAAGLRAKLASYEGKTAREILRS